MRANILFESEMIDVLCTKAELQGNKWNLSILDDKKQNHDLTVFKRNVHTIDTNMNIVIGMKDVVPDGHELIAVRLPKKYINFTPYTIEVKKLNLLVNNKSVVDIVNKKLETFMNVVKQEIPPAIIVDGSTPKSDMTWWWVAGTTEDLDNYLKNKNLMSTSEYYEKNKSLRFKTEKDETIFTYKKQLFDVYNDLKNYMENKNGLATTEEAYAKLEHFMTLYNNFVAKLRLFK